LSDAGAFEPIIEKLLNAIGRDPVKITIGTALLAMLLALNGSGAVTFLVTIPAMITLYKALGMRSTTLATITALSSGTMNLLPWGGPTLRAATALEADMSYLFNPMIIPMVCGLIAVLAIAVHLGLKERALINAGKGQVYTKGGHNIAEEATAEMEALKRPKLFVFNILLILIAILAMIMEWFAPQIVFLLGSCIAILVNYPKLDDQKKRISAQAESAMMMGTVVLAAGCFNGIMRGTEMITAMAEQIVLMVPTAIFGFLPVVIGVLSMPLSLLFDPDSYYFGVLPVLASSAAQAGIDPILIGRASILGQMTTGFPVSPLTPATFLLVGLSGIDLAEHQKKTIPYAFSVTIVMLIVSLLIGSLS